MAFVSTRDNREIAQTITPAKLNDFAVPSFSEVYAASLGQVIDEELSISSSLNNEGLQQRGQLVKQLSDSGQINVDQYTLASGLIDYDALAKETENPLIKTDRQIMEERNELLRQRREYAEDVKERGSGLAQFLGMATAYVLDPVNILTMPIATAGVGLKSLTTVGKALTVAKNEAALATATELMIQPLVYQHKHDIGSPFEFKDALFNIATAASGAFVVGGSIGGISGYLQTVREKASKFPLDDDSVLALEALARIEDDLNLNPIRKNIELDLKEVEQQFISDIKTQLESDLSGKITRGERKQLTAELQALKDELSRVKEPAIEPAKGKDIPARKAKAEAEAEAKRLSEARRLDITNKMEAIVTKLESDELALKAKGNLTRIEQGIIPEEFKTEIEKLKNEKQIEVDKEFLTQMNSKMEAVNPPSKRSEDYTLTTPEQKINKGTISERERDLLNRVGIAEDYDLDIQKFKLLESPKIIQNDEIVDAGDFMKNLDQELEGLEDVMRCSIG